MVRNSPSAISSETSRSTALRPNVLATLRMLSRGAFASGWALALTAAEGIGEAMELDLCARDTTFYCAAFTSFQISVYFSRRGTFCQKYIRFW